MLIVTTESVNGGRFEQLGLVRGSSIMTVHAGKDIMNSFKTLVGGELTSYNEMMENARGLATQRMIEQAQSMGALQQQLRGPGRGRGDGLRHRGAVCIGGE